MDRVLIISLASSIHSYRIGYSKHWLLSRGVKLNIGRSTLIYFLWRILFIGTVPTSSSLAFRLFSLTPIPGRQLLWSRRSRQSCRLSLAFDSQGTVGILMPRCSFRSRCYPSFEPFGTTSRLLPRSLTNRPVAAFFYDPAWMEI